MEPARPIRHLRAATAETHRHDERDSSPGGTLMGNRKVTARSRHDECLPPVVGTRPRTLILGSLPGRKSLEMQQYYAHPQNAFWKIVAQLFGAPSSLPYGRRVKILTDHHIALWDVLAAAERPGSLDSSIIHATAR